MFLYRNVFYKINLNFQLIKNVRFYAFAAESNMDFMLKNICLSLSCTAVTALSLYKKFPSVRSEDSLRGIKKNIEILTDNDVSKEIISNNLFLLIMKVDSLQRNLNVIREMQPEQIVDLIPLLAMKERILKQVSAMSIMERDIIPEKSRIYYLSKELQIKPETLSEYCSKYDLIFFMPFTSIERKMKILLDYNVDRKQILQSLYVFESAEDLLISRLEKLVSNGLCDIKLWIFKLPDEKFEQVLTKEVKKKRNANPTELPQKFDKENLEKLTILNELNSVLACDDKTSAKIYYSFIKNFEQLHSAKENIQFLTMDKVSLESIRENSILLTLPLAQMKDNFEIIRGMNPKTIEEFLPLVGVETSKLKVFVYNLKKKANGHPIYVFSEKLKLPPNVVSKYFAKHSDVFFGDFNLLQQKLDILIAHNVQPISIIKSPQTFGLSVEKLKKRLNTLKSEGIESISAWMLYTAEARLQSIVTRQIEEKESLGGSLNSIDYLANRLNWDDAAKVRAIHNYPPLKMCSVLKVKAHLDYLLNETHFTITDINSNIAVFRCNLDELKLRMKELLAIGIIPTKLYQICLAKKSYLEMIGKFCKKNESQQTFEMFKSIERRIKNV